MRKILYTTAHALPETEEGFDLGRSTALNLPFEAILDDAFVADLRGRHAGYGSVSGEAQLRAAIGERLGVEADEVLITHGAVGGLHLAVFCLCAEGDEVVTVVPGFPATFDIIGALGAVARSVPLDFDERYALDADRLAALISDRTRLVLLPSPHNPSGVEMPGTLYSDVLALMAERAPQAYLLIDETFREASYGAAPVSASAASMSPRVLTVASLSKAYGAPGLRVGWITCRDAALRAHLAVGKGKTAISCSILDERVARHIFEHAETILGERRAALAAGRSAVEAWIDANAERLEWVPPDAGGLCCVRLRADVYDAPAVERFYQAAVADGINMAAGDRFLGERREFRLGFGALPAETLANALDALARVARNVVEN